MTLHKYQEFINLDVARKFPGGRSEGIQVYVSEIACYTEHPDLRHNMRRLGPDRFTEHRRYHQFVDHGTQVCGIIGC